MNGIIDPRPWMMSCVQEDWGRVLKAGGAFAVVTSQKLAAKLFEVTGAPGFVPDVKPLPWDNWGFLDVFNSDSFRVIADDGEETSVLPSVECIQSFLKARRGTAFEVMLRVADVFHHEWGQFEFHRLIANKFGQCIGGMLRLRDSQGLILVLPRFGDMSDAVVELVSQVLPDLSPHLFPDADRGSWLHSPEYEHPRVLEHRAAQDAARAEADAAVARLEAEIVAERERLGFLHGILTKHDDGLVADLRRTLDTSRQRRKCGRSQSYLIEPVSDPS